MKRIIILLGLLLIMLPVSPVRAGDNTFGVAWGVSVPVGATHDFVPNVSFRGASVEWRNFYLRDAAYGINVGWNVFNQEKESTEEIAYGHMTGKRWKYINAVPVYASWFKYFSTDKRHARFFAGINAGTAWIEQRIEMSLYEKTTDNWHFAIAPEVGWNMPWESFLGYVGARYHYAFKAGETKAQQWIEIKIGFGLD